MRTLLALTAVLAITASATAFAQSAPSTTSLLANPNAKKSISQPSAPLATTQTTADPRQARINEIIAEADARRRNPPSASP
jgi:hypothetical protein